MSWMATAAVKQFLLGGGAPDLRAPHAALLYALADECQDDFSSFPSLDRLAAATRMDRGTVIRNLRTLTETRIEGQEKALLTIEERHVHSGRQTSNLYSLNLPPVVIAAAPSARDGGEGCKMPPSPRVAGCHPGGLQDATLEGGAAPPSTVNPPEGTVQTEPPPPAGGGDGAAAETKEKKQEPCGDRLKRLGVVLVGKILQQAAPDAIHAACDAFEALKETKFEMQPGGLADALLKGREIVIPEEGKKKLFRWRCLTCGKEHVGEYHRMLHPWPTCCRRPDGNSEMDLVKEPQTAAQGARGTEQSTARPIPS